MTEFESLKKNVGKFSLIGKRLLLPEMNRAGSVLLAATLRSFGIDARVMETYKGLDLGKKFTSGKECFPCQVTLGDVLYYLEKERQRLGERFRAENYLYFMAEAGGPCRFGMYNKLHRIILDSLDGFSNTRIASITSKDSYALGGLLPQPLRANFRRSAYVAIVIGDVLDRSLWHMRPYEREPGVAEEFFEEALRTMADSLEIHGRSKNFSAILADLEAVARRAALLIDTTLPPRPLIGMVGEIYLRSHRASNQDIIKLLEQHGGEVVNASIAEWVNYISYDRMQKAARDLSLAIRQRDMAACRKHVKRWLRNRAELTYQYLRQTQVYRTVMKHLHIHADHKIGPLERQLDNDRLYSFQVGTEAGLSIGGALEYCLAGFDGIVNVFPFTCMPSTMCSAILKPLLDRLQIPYIDSAYDGTFQPNREAIIRTFMYQAAQHQKQRLAGKAARHN
ncbi:MAG: CoA activase [Deltaproteobacteria bacterium]|nr:CoA activase [Deltaproteobacteria bacterium]MBW2070968.1 CoA activase [Deltaproteobacteria bacterium]